MTSASFTAPTGECDNSTEHPVRCAISRAFWQNYVAGEIESGASTITQQVARDLVLRNKEVTIDRKLAEIVVSAELTRRYTKDEILYLYLNDVAYFRRS